MAKHSSSLVMMAEHEDQAVRGRLGQRPDIDVYTSINKERTLLADHESAALEISRTVRYQLI